jgi:hypothetical protein
MEISSYWKEADYLDKLRESNGPEERLGAGPA